MFITGYENYDMTTNREPVWMKDERYEYCEDFYLLFNKRKNGLLSKLASITAMLFA